ncbi:MAG: hypothetical protein ABF356_10970 [Polycyclovorans sp.]
MNTVPKTPANAQRYNVAQSLEKLAAIRHRMANATGIDGIVTLLEQVNCNQHRLTFPAFTYFLIGLYWLAVLLSLGWLGLVAYAVHDDMNVWLAAVLARPQPDDPVVLGISICFYMLGIYSAFRVWRAMSANFAVLRHCLYWREDLRDCASRATETLLHGRSFPHFDPYGLANYWKDRFNHFAQGHENRYIANLEELNWPGSDRSGDIPEGRAQQYRFNYTVVTVHTESDSDGSSKRVERRTEHSSYGLVIPFMHAHWLLLQPALLRRGVWTPNHPHLRSHYSVSAQDQLSASRMLTPAVEVALADISSIAGGLKVEFTYGYLHIELSSPLSLTASAAPVDIAELIQWVQSARPSAAHLALVDLVADLRRHLRR